MSHQGSAVSWWRVLRAGGQAPEGHETEALRHYLHEGTPLVGAHDAFLRTGEGRWRVDLPAARWAPTEDDFDCMDAIAGQLEHRRGGLSVADDGMSV
jgi:hypothetical protein